MNVLPNRSLSHETRVVAPPVTARPSTALIQKLLVVLQRRLNLTLSVVLNPCPPSAVDQPARDKVVVISVQLILTPPLCPEPIKEQRTLEDFGTESTSTPRHTRGSSVKVVSRRNLEVAALNVGRTEPIVHIIHGRTVLETLNALARTNAAHLGILKWS